MSIKSILEARSHGSNGALLSGSAVPDGTKTVTIIVAELRESPTGFHAPAIIELAKPVYGATAWAVNQTNLKAIFKHFGDDEKQLVGKKIKLDVVSVRNPQTGQMVRSLGVSPKQ